jgi:hypothetical protein
VKNRVPKETLWRSVQRAAGNVFFLASALEAYRIVNQLDYNALAAHLGCSYEELPRLGLCRRPSTEPTAFRQDVERIASYASVRPDRLAQLLREVNSLQALQQIDVGAPGQGLLMAARDRDAEAERHPKETRKKPRSRKNPRQGRRP